MNNTDDFGDFLSNPTPFKLAPKVVRKDLSADLEIVDGTTYLAEEDARQKRIQEAVKIQREEIKNTRKPKAENQLKPRTKVGFFGLGQTLADVKDFLSAFSNAVKNALQLLGENDNLLLKEIRELNPRKVEVQKLIEQLAAKDEEIKKVKADLLFSESEVERGNEMLNKVLKTGTLLRAENAFELFIKSLGTPEVDLEPLKTKIQDIQEEIKSILAGK